MGIIEIGFEHKRLLIYAGCNEMFNSKFWTLDSDLFWRGMIGKRLVGLMLAEDFVSKSKDESLFFFLTEDGRQYPFLMGRKSQRYYGSGLEWEMQLIDDDYFEPGIVNEEEEEKARMMLYVGLPSCGKERYASQISQANNGNCTIINDEIIKKQGGLFHDSVIKKIHKSIASGLMCHIVSNEFAIFSTFKRFLFHLPSVEIGVVRFENDLPKCIKNFNQLTDEEKLISCSTEQEIRDISHEYDCDDPTYFFEFFQSILLDVIES